jgi:tRNA-modifying protein YgfZ
MNSNSGRLPHLGLLRFSGPDAFDFLQGQISGDSRRLADGRPLLAAYSSPQGRVLAVLHLLPHAGGAIAVLPRELVGPTRERLRKYVLRSRLKIDDAGAELCVAGSHGSAPLAAAGITVPEAGGYLETDGIGVAAVVGDAGRYWVMGREARLAAAHQLGDARDAAHIEEDWRLADIRAGLPQIYAATAELFVAQMLNLDLLDGISFSKGCYTGQEIITRTQHLGRIKRRMHRLQLPPGDYQVGQALRLADGRGGRLVEFARADDEGTAVEALAVLNTGTTAGASANATANATADAATGVIAGTTSPADAADPAGAAGAAGAAATLAAVELSLPYAVTSSS